MYAVPQPYFSPLLQLRDRLLRWLREEALPVWENHGIDRTLGGYFETVIAGAESGAYEARGPIRRGRVLARQMFVFDAGRRLGWQATQPDPARHGCEFLFSRMLRSDGHFHIAIDPLARRPQTALAGGAFDLYEYAFYLFSLARVHGELSGEYPTHETASTCLALLREGWGKPNGGFDESRPPSLPLKSNPHMHLFEAALAWIESTEQSPLEQSAWLELAEELCDLCLTHFIDARSGVLREFFDEAWRPMPDDRGRIVEPGHQFEWAWLLMQWARLRHCPDRQRQACHAAANRLLGIGERGVDPMRGVAVNELWDDLRPKDASAKLWPQTERIKAWCALVRSAESEEQRRLASAKLYDSILGLLRYLEFEAPGLWHEVLLPDGTFTREPCKASSLYHIVGAIEALDQCMSAAQAA
jgi:mannose/cellobiose epimerase-like protein (N-acyl-D-glucosamine 2-epimerase family)